MNQQQKDMIRDALIKGAIYAGLTWPYQLVGAIRAGPGVTLLPFIAGGALVYFVRGNPLDHMRLGSLLIDYGIVGASVTAGMLTIEYQMFNSV